ncbi:MAG: AAA family ATPase, partial [Pseudonocardiaceae bacterium]
GYPDPAAELAMVDEHAATDPLATLQPVSTAAEVTALCQAVRLIHVATDVRRYVVDVVNATRRMPELRLGASPRATLQLVRTSRAAAALAGRDFVVPDDVQTVAPQVLAHRLVLTAEAQADRLSPEGLVRSVLARVPVPQAPAGSAAVSVGRRGDRNGAGIWHRSPRVP